MLKRDEMLASRIAGSYSLPTHPITVPKELGMVNHVYFVGASTTRYVIRFARDAKRLDEFSKEAWCLRQAAACGIPSPEVIAHGLFEGVPHLVLRFVAGRVGEHLRAPYLWQTLGQYARTIQQISLGPDAPSALFSRFGREPVAAWHAHLTYNRQELTPDDPLLRLGGYPLREQPRLRDMIEELAGKQLTFGLSHGDLALRNLVLEPGRQPVLLDWGSASVGPAPHTDLLNLLRNRDSLHNPRNDEIQAFADGYGEKLPALWRTLELMQQLAALDLVRWAVAHRADLVQETVAALRLRLQGSQYPT